MKNTDNIREDERKRVKKLLEDKMSFATHLIVFILVNAFILLPVKSFSDFDFFPIPTICWGVGLLTHFLKVFVYNSDYIEKKVDEKLNHN